MADEKDKVIYLFLATYLVLALAYSVVVPPFEGLDEMEHFGVTRYVAETGQLPVQGDPALEAYHARQEASQPPLYYLVTGPLLRLSRISTADTAQYLIPNPYVTCGTENIRHNKNVLRHDPFAEAFPWQGALLALHLLRALSILLQALTVVGVYAIARRVLPDRPGVAALSASLTAFNPQFLIVASSVNNDNIATPIITWAVCLCIVVAQEGKGYWVLGILIGLAALSKLTGLLLVLLALMAWFQSFRSRNTQYARAARNIAITAGIAALVAGWWYIRNWQIYGDPTGLAPMLNIVGRREPVPIGLLLSELSLVFRSYWGQFSCAFFDSQLYYSAWTIVTVVGLCGLAFGWHRRESLHTPRSTLYLLLTWFLLVFIGWLRWDLITPAPGGRLLFSAVGATSTLLAFGLTSLLNLLAPRSVLDAPPSSLLGHLGSVAMMAVATLALALWVRPLFAPPPMVMASTIKPQKSLDAHFGESIHLLGYDLHADDWGPGRYVDVTLYWRADRRMSVDYTLALQLVALAPGDTRTLLNFNTWPGGGHLPTAAWPVGPAIVDHYRVPLPLSTGTTQAWRLQMLFYDAASGNRLPLTLNDQPAGEALTLSLARVAGTSSISMPDATRLATPVTFDQKIALTHAQVQAQGNMVRVRLLWHSLSPLSRDLTVFAHAYDAHGKLVATGDGPPMKGNFPALLWHKGDLVLDEHALDLPSGLTLGDVTIKVGLYQPEDGRRLEAWQGASRLPDDAVRVKTLP